MQQTSMLKSRNNHFSYIIEATCFMYILLWVYAAISKLSSFDKFQGQLSQSPMLISFSVYFAYGIPLLEIGLAILLCWTATRKPAILASFTLMTMFSVYIFLITRYSSFVPCSCGGILEKLSWNEHLIFNIGLLFIAGLAYLFYPPNQVTT
ncbi:MauE/DoxX family redox-associated membrane protein [Flavihumibacter fluvii]|uniref:MauE/DoxX family redox-associated membrane protein n=1 Tax=Flavihumibacter fluvii TaxID=2838157 RepID=UPI001BDE0B18|nr:MauE/DoxX family redox-associated membrane protein [Flavihumibacter fluvii]ULQ52172.1 hypothetical protein KJS93_18945 [Flavihumibacter fluvii]